MALNITKTADKLESKLDILPKYMNSYLFYGPYDIRYEKTLVPKINDSEILVKVNAALTCGTDLKTFERGHPILIRSMPSKFGHQFAGTIILVGRNVNKFYEGQRIVALNSAPCFSCSFCLRNESNLCENLEFLNGAYAEYIAIPERIVKHNTYSIPNGVSFEAAALLESLSVVLHGLEKSEILKGKTVCIIGAGTIGLLFALLSNLRGAKVITVGRTKLKLDTAKELGAEHVFSLLDYDEPQRLIKDIKNVTSGIGPDVVIEAVGLPTIWELATRIVRRGGLVSLFGGCQKGSTVAIDTYRLHYDELKLVGVFHHTPQYARQALSLIENKLFEDKILNKIITHRVGLGELKRAFLMQKSGEAIQVVVKP